MRKEINHWPYTIYKDTPNTLYVHDREEGLVFVREETGHGLSDVSVILENVNYYSLTWVEPKQPYGVTLLEDISLDEWKKLVKDYKFYKSLSRDVFEKWIKEKLYDKLDEFWAYTEYFIETTDPPY